jgi:DNA-binding transcriptional LysR family regulator
MNDKPSRPTMAQLRALVAVAAHGSYSEAALETDQSQSTLSHAIQDLERNLGARLLERGRSGAKLTTLGTRVLEHARDAVQSLEALEQEVALETGSLRGTVRVMSYRSLATHVLPGALQRFRALYPGVTIDLQDGGRVDRFIPDYLHQDAIDVGLLDVPTESSDLLEFDLVRDEYVLVSSDSIPVPRTWADIQKHPYIMGDGTCTRRIRQHWDSFDCPLIPAFSVSEDGVILSMVAQGLGISVMPSLAAHPLPPGVRVGSLPVPLERRLGLAVTRRKMTIPAIRAFVETVLQHVEQHPLESPLQRH